MAALARAARATALIAPSCPTGGAVAQLGERRNRTAEVRGSNPLGSTRALDSRLPLNLSAPENRLARLAGFELCARLPRQIFIEGGDDGPQGGVLHGDDGYGAVGANGGRGRDPGPELLGAKRPDAARSRHRPHRRAAGGRPQSEDRRARFLVDLRGRRQFARPLLSQPARGELREQFPDMKIEVINRGVGGEDAKEMLARLDKSVLAERPDLVLWQVGTNAIVDEEGLSE